MAEDPSLNAYVFEYEPAWTSPRASSCRRSSMPTTAAQTRFAFPLIAPSFQRLPGLLADALPDKFGNALIDAWMASHGISRDSITALDRLAYMGRRGLGALEFHPAMGSAIETKRPLEMKELVEEARRAVRGNLSDDAHARAALSNIIRVGTSAGGARAKAVVAFNPQTQEVRSGQFDVEDGFEHWLLKFDGIGEDLALGTTGDYGRIEYAYHRMAVGAGIVMAPCRLMLENGRAHFMTRRFDREGNQKHHIQSLCALQHLDYNQRAAHAYEQYFLVISRLELGDGALQQAFRRMAFNVMARNCDDHTKNFGFRLMEGGRWELSPAYDVTHAHNPASHWTAQHLMSVNGQFAEIAKKDLLAVADRFLVPDAKKLLAEVRAAVEDWPKHAAEADLPHPKMAAIAKDFRLV